MSKTEYLNDDRLLRYLVYAVLGSLAVILGYAAVKILLAAVMGILKLGVAVGVLALVAWIAYRLLV
ncbi:MAG: hypothetical protein SV253_02625 [Halobacteria archaeon]|nr:hypothetical protein [Halobacteria archaeon]